MNKKLNYMITIFIIAFILQPCFIKAEAINLSNEKSSNTWQGDYGSNDSISVNRIGTYKYSPQKDSFMFDFDFGINKNIQDFFIVKDTILGKPVTDVYYQEYYGATIKNPKIGIYIPDNVTTLGINALGGFQFSHAYLSSNIKRISGRCCWGNNNLERLILPSNLKIICEEAFAWCPNLNLIKVPSSVTSIEKKAFYSCTKLTKIYLPNSVKKIEKDVFKGCDKLTIYCEKNSYAYNYAKKNKIKTKVLSNKIVKANEITNLSSTIQVGTHETFLLFSFVEPFYATNQTLAYISDDPSIAEVNQNGKVEGKKKGTTTITVMTTDGSHRQKKVNVTVKQGETSINPYFSLYQLKKGTTEFNVDAMLYNRNVKATYQIESSDSTIATAKVIDGTLKVTTKKDGNALFVVTEKNGSNKNELGSFPISVIHQ